MIVYTENRQKCTSKIEISNCLHLGDFDITSKLKK